VITHSVHARSLSPCPAWIFAVFHVGGGNFCRLPVITLADNPSSWLASTWKLISWKKNVTEQVKVAVPTRESGHFVSCYLIVDSMWSSLQDVHR
jgi:hypothetical protein